MGLTAGPQRSLNSETSERFFSDSGNRPVGGPETRSARQTPKPPGRPLRLGGYFLPSGLGGLWTLGHFAGGE